LLRDASVALAPLTRGAARAMLAEGRRSVLLRGFRGTPAVDEDALGSLLVGVGDLLTDCPAVEELDLNPLIASAGRLVAVDALVLVNAETDARGGQAHGT
jgi:acetyltransferase